MDLGRYIDGRAVTYDQGNGTFKIGDAPVNANQIRAYLSAGHIAWASADIASWFARTFPAEATSGPAPAPSGRGALIVTILIGVVAVFFVCGILVSIAIPAFSSARVTAQAKSCWASQRAIEGGAELYKEDHGSAPKTIDALVPDVLATKPVCPAGGTYNWDPATGRCTCSIHGNYALNPRTRP